MGDIMMKAKNVQSISCFVLLFLFIVANHVWAADWILFGQTMSGDKIGRAHV
jgi:hypothetical protein